MLIAEALYLLLTDKAGSPEVGGLHNLGSTAAVITDLVVAERVVVSDEEPPRVHLISREPVGDPVLDAAIRELASNSGQRFDQLIWRPTLDPRITVVTSLIQQGVIALGKRTMLGLGPYKTPELNPEPEQMVRMRIAAVLAGQAAPDIAETTLLAILQGMQVAPVILRHESGGMNAPDLKARIDQVVAASPAGSAVEKGVRAMATAMMSTVVTPTDSS